MTRVPTSAAPRRVGSSMSNKQLARTVLDGKPVTFRFAKDDQVTGYLCGMDDFHWLIIESSGEKHLIHKGSAPRITLGDSASYADEANIKILEQVIGPFRRYVEQTFFGRADAVDAIPATEGISA